MEEFKFTGDKSNINDMVEFLNKGLLQGFKVSELRNILDIGEKPLQRLLKANGYKHNQKLKAYVKTTDENLKNPPGLEKQSNNTVNTNMIQSNYTDNKELIEVLSTVKEMKLMQTQFQEMYQWYKNQTDENIIDVTIPEFKIIKNENDTISRNLRIYIDTNKRFKEFCEKHSESKIQDILNTALIEFLNKYE